MKHTPARRAARVLFEKHAIHQDDTHQDERDAGAARTLFEKHALLATVTEA